MLVLENRIAVCNASGAQDAITRDSTIDIYIS